MFGLWYVVISFVVVAILGIVGLILDKYCDYVELSASALAAGLLGGIISTASAIFVPIECKKELVRFEQQSEYIAMIVENGTDLENIAISQTVIEQNEWLAGAKADIEIYGCWSGYYGLGIEELQPITIKR